MQKQINYIGLQKVRDSLRDNFQLLEYQNSEIRQRDRLVKKVQRPHCNFFNAHQLLKCMSNIGTRPSVEQQITRVRGEDNQEKMETKANTNY